MLDKNFKLEDFTLLDTFYRYCKIEKQRTEKTISDYTQILNKFCEVLDITTNKQLIELSNENILSYLDYLQEKQYKVASKNQKIMCLKSFYHFLEEYEYIDKNPWKRIHSFKDKDYRETTYLTEEEAQRFILGCKNLRDKAVFTVFLTMGVRLSELINMELDNLFLDVESPYILVRCKGQKMQKKYIPSYTAQIIKEYIVKFRNKKFPNCQYNNLFISNSGKPMNRVAITNSSKVIARRVGIDKNIHPHSFRHSFASIQLEKGASLKEVQLQLGHAQLSTTANIYTHIRGEVLSEGINKYNFNLNLKLN